MNGITPTLAACLLFPGPMALAQVGEDRPQARPPTLKTREQLIDYATKAYENSIGPALREKCGSCHGAKKPAAGLNIEALKPDFLSDDSYLTWMAIDERIRDGEMPPRDEKPEPPASEAGADELAPRHQRREEAAADDRFALIARINAAATQIRSESEFGSDRWKILESDDALTRLLKRRAQAANARLESEWAFLEQGVDGGGGAYKRVHLAHRTLLEASLELAKSPAQQLQVHKAHLDNARSMEQFVYQRYIAGIASTGEYFEAKFNRLDALVKLQKALEKSKVTVPRR